ncbi:MAG TPA: hypothetical protein VH500_04530 [Nitrososphaeraceae archaeon]
MGQQSIIFLFRIPPIFGFIYCSVQHTDWSNKQYLQHNESCNKASPITNESNPAVSLSKLGATSLPLLILAFFANLSADISPLSLTHVSNIMYSLMVRPAANTSTLLSV